RYPETSCRTRCRVPRRRALIHGQPSYLARPAHHHPGRLRLARRLCQPAPAARRRCPATRGHGRHAQPGAAAAAAEPRPGQQQRAGAAQGQYQRGQRPLRATHRPGRAAQDRQRQQCGHLQFREPAGAGGGQGHPGRSSEGELHHRAGRGGQHLLLHLPAGGTGSGAADPGDPAQLDPQCPGQARGRLCGAAGKGCRLRQPGAQPRRRRPAGGLQARLFPLRYISATEMQKLIKPFVRKDAVLLVDPSRNLLVLAGTPQELADDERMVRTFDVDWLRGTSVGVFNLQYAKVGELMPKLDALFGERGSTPLAGMLRFIPIERTNALVVISTQPDYLSEVGDWIGKIDAGGGNQPQLFVYDVRNLKASDLARYLAQIYTNGAGSGGDNGGQVGPGLGSATLGSADNANTTSLGSTAGGFGNTGTGLGSSGSGGLNGSSGSGFGSSGGLSRDGSSSTGTGMGGTASGGMSSAFGSSGQGIGSGSSGSSSQQYA